MPVTITSVPALPGDDVAVGFPVASDESIAPELAEQGFEGKVGQTARAEGGYAVGVGPAADVDAEVIRRASAALVKAASKRAAVVSSLLDAVPAGGDRAAAAQAAAEGSALAGYRFSTYKSNGNGNSKASTLAEVAIVAKGGKRVRDAVDRGARLAEAVAFARDLVNTPAGDLTPAVFAEKAKEVAKAAGLTIEVIDERKAEKLGLGGLLGVGKASENPPRMVKLTYTPTGRSRGHVALVGKGITFDSGGLTLKPYEGMMQMKTDMAGAAAVLAAMSVLPEVAPPVQVTAYLCLAENMVSGRAIRPGDVLTIKNGTTVEVLNTDAEGRLVLADGLSLAVAENPDAIVDVATLTGACMVALGARIAGLMGNDDVWIDQVRAAADRVSEAVWPLPLPKEYRKELDSDVADLKNVGGRNGGALTAGLFLQEFVGDRPWAHLDIAGPSRYESDDAYIAKGSTGFGVRTLVELVSSFRKPR
jgi:leucyl aminopeptidase